MAPVAAAIEKELSPASEATREQLSRESFDWKSDGSAENEFLRLRAAKYEDRLGRAVVPFFIASVLAVSVKGGVPISQAAMERLGLPPVENTHIVVGMLGSAAAFFFVIIVYYALRMHQFSKQQEFRFPPSSLVGNIAEVMRAAGVVFLVITAYAVISISWPDVLYLANYMLDHYRYVLDGWEGSIER